LGREDHTFLTVDVVAMMTYHRCGVPRYHTFLAVYGREDPASFLSFHDTE
jgi:hypothetical protein